MNHLRLQRSILALGAALLLTAVSSASVSEVFKRTYPLTPDGVVSLSNISGSVEITGWDKAEVSLEAEKIAASDDGLALIAVNIEMTPSSLTIKTVQTKKWKFWSLFNKSEVRYKLMVPAGARLQKIDVVNSNITVHGVRGRVNLDTVNGRIVATGLSADGRFDTVNGAIDVAFDSLKNVRRVVLDTVNGSCKLRLPADASAHVDADTVNGRITCEFPIRLESSGRHSLRGLIGDGATEIVLDSVNGSLHIETK